MAIGALFTPKLAGKVHNLHYQSIQQKQTKWKLCNNFGNSVHQPCM